MPHINKLIDFTVVAYIAREGRVLMVFHKKLEKWLPLGGHIEPDEDPDQALLREIKEESGLEDIEILGTKPELSALGTKFLYAPAFMDIHDISEGHRHVGLIYFARLRSGDPRLSQSEHNEIRWFSASDLGDARYNLLPSIKFYAAQALRQVR
ncbi:MAG: NUDIX domain-containing protein [Candidatus Wildermuthbacteria bacterium]|nr:NUDIX domain-containing protein [Candidatus Wildermuthbacteria bacterium]